MCCGLFFFDMNIFYCLGGGVIVISVISVFFVIINRENEFTLLFLLFVHTVINTEFLPMGYDFASGIFWHLGQHSTMRLPPAISLLAFPLYPSHLTTRQRCPTKLFTRGKQFDDEAIPKQIIAVDALPPDLVAPPHQHALTRNNNAKQRRRRTPKNNSLTSRQKSISLGNDPLISLNLNLDHLAKSTQNPASARRAEEMLLRIEALHSDGYYERPPDVVSYNCVINAYAHGRAIDERLANGKRLLHRMTKKGIQPNEVTYNTLLSCLGKEMDDTHQPCSVSRRRDKLSKAESLLAEMEELKLANTISYNTIIAILSKSRLHDSPKRAEYWLRRMIELYNASGEDRLQPDVCSFNSVIHAYANAIADSKHSSTQTNNQNTSIYAQRAEELLLEMETLYASGHESVEPDIVSYGAVIHAYARAASRGNDWCADKAMQILDKLEKNVLENQRDGRKRVQPNKRTYASVINAFARIGNADAADAILSKMKKISSHEDGDALKPDTICYTSVIDACEYRKVSIIHVL
ncbi:hypothetical protein ACHAWX_006911 [Stephanocyclus meneghinianus]